MLLPTLACLVPSVLAGPGEAPSPPERVVTAGYGGASYGEYWTSSGRPAAELSGTLRLDPGVEATVGVRRLFSEAVLPIAAFDLFVAGRAAPAVVTFGKAGRWAPAVGLELGLTGALRRDWAVVGAESPWALEREDTAVDDVAYAAVLLDPLHGRVGPVAVSLGSLSVGSTLPSWGQAIRLEFTWARLGVAW